MAGCGDLQVDAEGKAFVAPDGSSIKEGDWLSVDGTTGEVLRGQIETQEPEVSGDFARFMQWVRSVHSALHVHANADTPEDVARAVELGAQGVGLVRTEHMFFGEDRIPAMRRMILAETEEERVECVALLPSLCDAASGSLTALSLPVRWSVCTRSRRETLRAFCARRAGARSLSASSTRLCTSSCPGSRPQWRRWRRC